MIDDTEFKSNFYKSFTFGLGDGFAGKVLALQTGPEFRSQDYNHSAGAEETSSPGSFWLNSLIVCSVRDLVTK